MASADREMGRRRLAVSGVLAVFTVFVIAVAIGALGQRSGPPVGAPQPTTSSSSDFPDATESHGPDFIQGDQATRRAALLCREVRGPDFLAARFTILTQDQLRSLADRLDASLAEVKAAPDYVDSQEWEAALGWGELAVDIWRDGTEEETRQEEGLRPVNTMIRELTTLGVAECIS